MLSIKPGTLELCIRKFAQQSESTDSQPDSQCEKDDLRETEEQVWIPMLSNIVVSY